MTRWDIGCEEATECLEFGQKLRSVVLLPSFAVLPPAFPASCQKAFLKRFDPATHSEEMLSLSAGLARG